MAYKFNPFTGSLQYVSSSGLSGLTDSERIQLNSAIQPGDNISDLNNDAQYLNATTLASTSVEIDCGDFTNPV